MSKYICKAIVIGSLILTNVNSQAMMKRLLPASVYLQKSFSSGFIGFKDTPSTPNLKLFGESNTTINPEATLEASKHTVDLTVQPAIAINKKDIHEYKKQLPKIVSVRVKKAIQVAFPSLNQKLKSLKKRFAVIKKENEELRNTIMSDGFSAALLDTNRLIRTVTEQKKDIKKLFQEKKQLSHDKKVLDGKITTFEKTVDDFAKKVTGLEQALQVKKAKENEKNKWWWQGSWRSSLFKKFCKFFAPIVAFAWTKNTTSGKKVSAALESSAEIYRAKSLQRSLLEVIEQKNVEALKDFISKGNIYTLSHYMDGAAIITSLRKNFKDENFLTCFKLLLDADAVPGINFYKDVQDGSSGLKRYGELAYNPFFYIISAAEAKILINYCNERSKEHEDKNIRRHKKHKKLVLPFNTLELLNRPYNLKKRHCTGETALDYMRKNGINNETITALKNAGAKTFVELCENANQTLGRPAESPLEAFNTYLRSIRHTA